jgi:putative surface-exposed virulence protein
MTIKSRLLIAVTLCFSSSTSALADDFIIDGPATTTNNGYVLDGDDTITVTNTGSVSTTADFEPGLSALGDNNVLTNDGDISTGTKTLVTVPNNGNPLSYYSRSGSASHGLHAEGDFNTITNSENGVVSAIGPSAIGLFAGTWNTGDNNTLVNRGIIITDGGSGHAMHAGGNNNTLTNSGDINVNEFGGGSGHGMFGGNVFGGDFNIVTNTGSITTNGGSGHGMTAGGSYNTLTNSGDIIVNET